MMTIQLKAKKKVVHIPTSEVDIKANGISKFIDKLNENKATSPGEISSKFPKDIYRNENTPVLTNLFIVL